MDRNNQESRDLQPALGREGVFHLPFGARAQDMDLLPDRTRRCLHVVALGSRIAALVGSISAPTREMRWNKLVQQLQPFELEPITKV